MPKKDDTSTWFFEKQKSDYQKVSKHGHKRLILNNDVHALSVWATSIELLSFYSKIDLVHEGLGIYFLFEGKSLVYIGSSKNVRKRIMCHIREMRIKFSHIFWIESDLKSNRYQTYCHEKHLIKKHKPAFNAKNLVYSNIQTP